MNDEDELMDFPKTEIKKEMDPFSFHSSENDTFDTRVEAKSLTSDCVASSISVDTIKQETVEAFLFEPYLDETPEISTENIQNYNVGNSQENSKLLKCVKCEYSTTCKDFLTTHILKHEEFRSDAVNAKQGFKKSAKSADELDSENVMSDDDSDVSSLHLSDSYSDVDMSEILDNSVYDEPDNDGTASDAWSADGAARDPFVFKGNEGCKLNSNIEASDVLKIYESVVNDAIVRLICDETNVYGSKFVSNARKYGLKKRSRLNAWKEVSPEEIRLFEGILLLMGIVQKPSLESYFSKNPLINTPIFYEMIKRDRFLMILKFLHFSHSTDTKNKLYKVDELLKLYKQSFRAAYTPSRYVYVDERILLSKGRFDCKVNASLKETKFSVGSFMLCESKTGYVYNFIVRTDNGPSIPLNLGDPDVTKQSQSTKIVLSLMEDSLDKGYFLGLNNYYSCIFLFNYLVSHQTHVIGTVRDNRKGLPRDLVTATLRRGEASFRYRDKLMLVKWKDRKELLIMSTFHDATMEAITTREGIQKQKPKIFIDYKDIIAGGDTIDQFALSTNIVQTYLKKYYKKIYLQFLDISVHNSYVIHKKLGGRLTFLQFKLELVTALFEKYGDSTDKPKRCFRPSNVPSPSRLSGRHFLEEAPKVGSRHQRRQCVVCASQKKKASVHYNCEQCKVFLCPTKCFKEYHTKANLAEKL